MVLTAIISFVIGIIGWSFTEYAMHNWYGHLAKGKNDFSREHLMHHARKDYFAPTGKKLQTAVPVLSLLGLVSVLLVGWVAGLAFIVGFAATYTGYEVLHYRLHVAPPSGWYSRWARKHHFSHHFNCPKSNHGVTSPIWDIVFRTYERPRVVRVPRKMAMDWLLDDEGRLRAEFSADYDVREAHASPRSTARDSEL
ncbi:MAG: sterol desaturase family protein, partial [Myxococcales bacterium]|nr:sterol desaturase family protein [Myxococcales bacterium]